MMSSIHSIVFASLMVSSTSLLAWQAPCEIKPWAAECKHWRETGTIFSPPQIRTVEDVRAEHAAGRSAARAGNDFRCPFDGHSIGIVNFRNNTNRTVVFTLWHPANDSVYSNTEVDPRQTVILDGIAIGNDWKVQIDGGPKKCVAEVSHFNGNRMLILADKF